MKDIVFKDQANTSSQIKEAKKEETPTNVYDEIQSAYNEKPEVSTFRIYDLLIDGIINLAMEQSTSLNININEKHSIIQENDSSLAKEAKQKLQNLAMSLSGFSSHQTAEISLKGLEELRHFEHACYPIIKKRTQPC